MPRPVDLSDGGTMRGLFFEILEKRLGSCAELPLECPHHQRIRERRHGGLGLRELPGVGVREQVFVDAQHLGELERAAFEFAEGVVNRLGVSLIQFLAEPAPVLGIATGNHSTPIVLQIIDSHPRSGRSQRRHAADGPGPHLLLIAPLVFRRLARCPSLATFRLLHGVNSPFLGANTTDFQATGSAAGRQRSRMPGCGTDRKPAERFSQ